MADFLKEYLGSNLNVRVWTVNEKCGYEMADRCRSNCNYHQLSRHGSADQKRKQKHKIMPVLRRVLVLSGEATKEEAKAYEHQPDYIMSSVDELHEA